MRTGFSKTLRFLLPFNFVSLRVSGDRDFCHLLEPRLGSVSRVLLVFVFLFFFGGGGDFVGSQFLVFVRGAGDMLDENTGRRHGRFRSRG